VFVHNTDCGKKIVISEDSIKEALSGSTMKTIQVDISAPKVERFANMMADGKKFPPIKVDGDVIVEGNHRYVAGKVAKVEVSVDPGVVPSSQVGRIRSVKDYLVDPEDWGD
jgi:hypothetical protein